jgi:hypothetical protein
MLSALGFAAFTATPASAASTNIASTIWNQATCTTQSVPYCSSENYAIVNEGGTNQAVTVPPTGSFGFVDSFTQGTNFGSNLGVSAYYGSAQTEAGAPWNFQDNILFSTNGAAAQAQAIATMSSASGVSDLQIRIISATNPGTGNPWDVTNAANAATLLGPNGGVTVVPGDGWQTYNFAGTDFTVTDSGSLTGYYILQVRGEAANGATYSGNISFTAVPLPSAGWLMLSGLAGAGLLVRRRSAPA